MAQPSPTASGTITPTPAVNLEGLDFGHPSPIYPRPFKSAPAKPRHPRRNKNLKQILQDEQKALAAQAAEAGVTEIVYVPAWPDVTAELTAYAGAISPP